MTDDNDLLKANRNIGELQKEILRLQSEVVARAKVTQALVLFMTIVAFFIGVAFIVVAVFQILVNNEFIFAGLSIAGGSATILGTLLYNPMRKAQSSMADLAQVQVALSSFSSKVTIWIEYVKGKSGQNTGLEVSRVKDITMDIENAAINALKQIKDCCKEDE